MSKHTKWKMSKGESFKSKLSKPSTFRKFNRVEKASIFCFLLIAGFWGFMYGTYAITGQNILNPDAKADPFAIIWNGQVPSNYNTNSGSSGSIAWLSTTGYAGVTLTNPTTKTITIVNYGDAIVVTYAYFGGGAPPLISSITDSFGTGFTDKVNAFNGGESRTSGIWAGLSAGSGADTLTITWFTNGVTQFIDLTVSEFSGVSGFGNTSSNTGTGATSTATITITTSGNAIVEVETMRALVPVSLTPQDGQTQKSVRTAFCCDIYDMNYKLNLTSGSNTFRDLCATSCGTFGWSESLLELTKSSVSLSDCSGSQTVDRAGYLCLNARFASGQLQLNPNATTQGIAISKGAIDLSPCSAKPCAFANAFFGNSFNSAQRWAFALTANSTLPIQASYNPINDTAVALLIYCVKIAGSNMNCYVYMQRQPGQAPALAVGDDFYPNCNYVLTLFRCMTVPLNIAGGSNGDNLVANYTGGNLGGKTSGGSYWCGGSVASGPNTCDIGGIGYIADSNGGAISYAGYKFNQTLFPWLNLQNNYHAMYWENKGGDNLNWATAQASLGSVISYYIPPSQTTNPTTDTGGFFGWVGRSLGGAWDAVSSFVSPILSPVLGFGNSLLNVVIAGFVQAINLLILAYRLALNGIGNLLGLGNIGDVLYTVLTTIGSLITNGFTAIVGFFTALGSIITSGYFTFLAGVAIVIGALLPAAIFLWNIIFNGAFTVTDILFFDYVLGMAMVLRAMNARRSCLKAFLGWISLNVFIFTFVFNAAWAIFDIVTRPIHRTKQTVDPVG